MAERGSEEWREKIAAGRKGKGVGRKHSDETKAKMRAARLANNHRKGTRHSDETRAKMRAAANPTWARGPGAVNWQGGRPMDSHGYILVYLPRHPNAVGNYVLEHRLVMEEMVGRPLTKDDIVHHLNHDKVDNRPENLQILSRSEHSRLHRLHDHSAPQIAAIRAKYATKASQT